MRILIVGSDRIFSIENFYIKYFNQANIKVSIFLAPNIFNDFYKKTILNKIAFRLGISTIYKSINRKFKRAVELENPEVIWVFKGMEIFPESLEWAKKRNIKLVNYNPDNPFLFSGRGSGNENISKSIGLYDLHFTYNLEIKEKLENDFNARVQFLPFGFEIDQNLYEHCASLSEIAETCFLGNPDSFRSAFIMNLANAGIEIAVFGHDWRKFVDHPKIKIRDAVYGTQQWEVLRRYRIQLNLMRPHNINSHNMRTFEVPGIGGIMLAPFTPEHISFFDDKEEAFFFEGLEDCVSTIQKVLSMTVQQADVVRGAARKRSVISGYDYKTRTAEVLKQFEILLR
jgi:spore maturation protein CgeB